jgi:hypothetical protein
MSKKFIQMTSGWIPVSVLLLFAAALIAGQARANLPADLKAVPAPMSAASMHIVVTGKLLKENLDDLPNVLESMLKLPIEVDLGNDAGRSSRNGENESAPRSLKQ